MKTLRVDTRFNMTVQACLTAGVLALTCSAFAAGPLAAKVQVKSVAIYTGGTPLAKPAKILVYDFIVNPDDVQVDKMQAMRPRHLIMGDKKPDAIAASAGKKYSTELIKRLTKAGLPVEHAAAGSEPSENTMVVQGAFIALKEGHKAERDTIGMGAGGADVETKVDVHVKTSTDTVLLSQFDTNTKAATNMGSAIPVAAGLNPVSAVAKSTVGDRRKTLNAYASKTADATAKEIFKSMAAQGWIKINDKGDLAE